MVTFNSRITKNGATGCCGINAKSAARMPRNKALIQIYKMSAQLREILALVPNDKVTVTIDCDAPDELRIPQEFLDEAGIPEDAVLEVYVEDGSIIVQEAIDDEE